MTKSSGKSKWLVVGGAGFIGSNLCRALLDRGDRVICADNLITGSWDNIQDLIERGLVCFRHDITEQCPDFMRDAIDFGLDGILYLASIASPKFYLKYPLQTIDANTIGLRNMLEVASKADCQLIYTSTSEVYGDPICEIQNEEYNGNVDPNCDRAVYDESKRMGETFCSLFNRKNWARAKIVRIFNTYGPGMHPDDGRVLPNFINQALNDEPLTVYGDGSQTRGFCYIDDMVNALLRVADYEISKGPLPVINLGDPYDHYTILEVANKVREAINPKLKIVHEEFPSDNDPKQRKPATARAQKYLCWASTTKFSKGLNKTIEYFRRLRNVASETE